MPGPEIVLPLMAPRVVNFPGIASHTLVDFRSVDSATRKIAKAEASRALLDLFAATGRTPHDICSGRDPLDPDRARAFLVDRKLNPALTWEQHRDFWAPAFADRDAHDWFPHPTEGDLTFVVMRTSDGLVRGVIQLTKIRVVDRAGRFAYVVAQPAPAFTAPDLDTYWAVAKALLVRGLQADFPSIDGSVVGRISGWLFPLGHPSFLWPSSVYPDLVAVPGAVLHGPYLRFVPSQAFPPPPSFVVPDPPPTAPPLP